ncbi:hypothetical protein EOM09_02810 [bacterium]|nr:hypothetical protein [bacterium]
MTFDIFLNKNNIKNEIKKNIEVRKESVWTVLNSIIKDVNKGIFNDKILDDISTSNLDTLKFFLNKYLAYNNITRMILPEIIKVSNFLETKEYISFLIKFFINKKIKFSEWLQLPIFGSKNIEKILKEKINMEDEEVEILLLYSELNNVKLKTIIEIIERN